MSGNGEALSGRDRGGRKQVGDRARRCRRLRTAHDVKYGGRRCRVSAVVGGGRCNGSGRGGAGAFTAAARH